MIGLRGAGGLSLGDEVEERVYDVQSPDVVGFREKDGEGGLWVRGLGLGLG